MSNFPPHTPSFEEPEVLRLEPRELMIPDDERESLSEHTSKMLEKIFPLYDFNETITSIAPFELKQDTTQAPNDEFRALLLKAAYNRVILKAEIEHVDNREYLVGANLVLFRHNQPGHAEIVLTADETQEEAINIDDPQYYLQSSDDRPGASTEILPLDARAVSTLLSGVLEQADPDQINAHTPRENMLDMVRAIARTGDDRSVERHGSYEITHEQTIGHGHSILKISDNYTHAHNGDTNRVSNTVELKITQPFDKEVSAETELHFSSYLDEINTTLGLSYNKDQSGGVDLSKTLDRTLDCYNDSETSYPSLFSEKLTTSLSLLIEQPEGTTIKRIG